MPDSPQHYPVRLTHAQRKVVAEIAPALVDAQIMEWESRDTHIPCNPWEAIGSRHVTSARDGPLGTMAVWSGPSTVLSCSAKVPVPGCNSFPPGEIRHHASAGSLPRAVSYPHNGRK